MNWKLTTLNEEEMQHIKDTMESAGYQLISKKDLGHNYADVLRHWLKDEFLLFRGEISVDQYVAFDLTKRGSGSGGQMKPISMCREANSENYKDREYGSSYLTGRELAAFAEVLKTIEEAEL